MYRIGLLLAACCCTLQGFSQISIARQLTESREEPLGLDVRKPRFTWVMASPDSNVVQTGYELQVTDPVARRTVWNSGRVNSDQSVLVSYGGPALASDRHYGWKVRVWDNHGAASAWSPVAAWQTGLLDTSDWKASWIGPAYTEEATRPSPLMRKSFASPGKVRSATLFVTAHGLYEARINGDRVGEDYLTPGWTSYHNRLEVQAYDVTELVRRGDNAIGVTLANGWYRGIIGYADHPNVYGKDIALLLQLDITYTDGSTRTVVSDGSWKSIAGPVRYAEIYNGETVDARKELPGWDAPGFDDNAWSGVEVLPFGKGNLVGMENQPVTAHETFHPVRIFKTPKGDEVIDFGQNLVGWVQATLTGEAGDTVRISHAEVLDKAGNFYTENLRRAKATDTYILKGGRPETFIPEFTWHGFRYARVEGVHGELKPEDFTAVAIYSDMPRTGTFNTSDSLLNQLQHNIQWGQNGNFLDVPTDCPQRDERLGWTGDAQVFSRTATFLRDVHSFFGKWLRDVAADQNPDGMVPHVIPNVLNPGDGGSTGWADVSTIVPWNMYLAYGDTNILRDQYASMKAWVGYMQSHSKNNLWNTGDHFGDWLYIHSPGDNSEETDHYQIAQCFYAHSVQLVIDAARVLGNAEDVAKYTSLLGDVKKAFLDEYVTPDGRLVSGTQTGYVLALRFDMLPENLQQADVERLVEDIHRHHDHLTTGFLGASYLCPVLTEFGENALAYKLLLNVDYPSWLYPVKLGATTIWERWDGIRPDGTFEDAGMNSFNHYAYGAIGDWMYRYMAGIDTYTEGPGYKHIRIQPHPGKGVSEVSASLDTYYGKVVSHWTSKEGAFHLDVMVPVNTKATVYLPGETSPIEVGSGTYHF